VGEFEAQAASLHLPDDGARQLRADMATVKVQIDLPTPDHYTMRERLQSARAILEHARCGAVAAGLLDLLRNLHLRRGQTFHDMRAHDRSGRPTVPPIARTPIDLAAGPVPLQNPPQGV
jgi:hypothetical protein